MKQRNNSSVRLTLPPWVKVPAAPEPTNAPKATATPKPPVPTATAKPATAAPVKPVPVIQRPTVDPQRLTAEENRRICEAYCQQGLIEPRHLAAETLRRASDPKAFDCAMMRVWEARTRMAQQANQPNALTAKRRGGR